jgi:hypothetical protein
MRGRSSCLQETITNWHSLSNLAAPIALIVRLTHGHEMSVVLDCMSKCNTPPAINTV